MNPNCVSSIRRKAVWGPKRTLAALFLLILGLAPSTSAASGRNGSRFHESRHIRQAPHEPAGRPGANVKSYKLDAELTRRAKGKNPGNTSPVIVRLQPGAQLPPYIELRRL